MFLKIQEAPFYLDNTYRVDEGDLFEAPPSKNEIFLQILKEMPDHLFATQSGEESKIQGRVYWLYYPKEGWKTRNNNLKTCALALVIYSLWIACFGMPEFHSIHIFALSYMAWLACGVTHTHIQVGDQLKIGTDVRAARQPDPQTGDYRGQPHLAIEIKVTPDQWRSLNSSITNDPGGRNCSTKSTCYLENALKKSLIANPWRQMALPATVYLLAKKFFGSDEIGEIEIRGKGKEVGQLISLGLCYEFFMITVIYPLALLIKTPKFP